MGSVNPNTELMSPSTSVDGWAAQLSNNENRFYSRKKPLPNLPFETYEAAELRPKSPMDLDIG